MKNRGKKRQKTHRQNMQDSLREKEFSQNYGKVQKRAGPLEAKTEQQGLAISTIVHHDISLLTGPAGTGKTYISASLACEALEANEISQIIITRPAIDMEDFGALPGELEDKFAPYLQPFMDAFKERFTPGQLKYMLENKVIEARPLSFMRGSTFNNAWVLLDEAQNTTVQQMKMFLTRIGYNSKMIISGDTAQSDLGGRLNGLSDLVQRIENRPDFGLVEFSKEDCVRHGLTAKILALYED